MSSVQAGQHTGRLQNKVAIITGAASGIGKSTAALFAKEGASVYLLDMNPELSKMEDAISGSKGFVVDITSQDEVEHAVQKIYRREQRIDILVNSAGVFKEGDILNTKIDDWDVILSVNLLGSFICMQAVLPFMLEQKNGSIINIASEAGIAAIAHQVAYNVSKAGVIMLTKSAAQDYAASHVRVNCVAPGRVDSPLVQELIGAASNPGKKRIELSEDRPMLRMGRPEEIAQACLVFATDDMQYATGSVLSVDGGYTL